MSDELKAVDEMIAICGGNDRAVIPVGLGMLRRIRAALAKREADGYIKVADALLICEQEAAEWDSDNLITNKNYAAHCGHLIAALAAKRMKT